MATPQSKGERSGPSSEMSKDLNPTKALIFRITHRSNVPWILDHGVHCRNSANVDPNYVNIGNVDLIQKRHYHPVRHAMGGTLSDYVPFYFTPFSPMMYNIKTGWNGIKQRQNDEIVFLVSSLFGVSDLQLPFLFTDMHAYRMSHPHMQSCSELFRKIILLALTAAKLASPTYVLLSPFRRRLVLKDALRVSRVNSRTLFQAMPRTLQESPERSVFTSRAPWRTRTTSIRSASSTR